MKSITTKAIYAFAFGMLFTACSRPYATVQRTQTEVAHAYPTVSAPTPFVSTPEQLAIAPETSTAQQTVSSQSVTEALDRYEAVASADNKLTVSEKQKLAKRMGHIKQLLAVTPMVDLSAKASTHKATAVERMMVKKIDKKIQQKLYPQKAQLNTGVLAGGAVLVILGLLLVLLTSGTAATLGLVSLLVGAVLLLIGLL